MNYIIKGNLLGFLCDDCTESISGVDVLLYLPYQKDNVLAATVANAKETFRVVNKEEAAARKDLLVARATTDDKGNFELSVSEKYGNTAFDIDFYCGTVPRFPKKGPKKDPAQFHITTFYPQWRSNSLQESQIFQWKYSLSAKWWCFIRGYFFDAWLICGHLTNCETGRPIANATVTAWDADLLTDDNLGSATTDANGHFRIDYTSIDFKQTFLSPWINVESDPGAFTFQSGPDVYFKATFGGVDLIAETAADARKNVGYCLCVDLCSKINVGDPNDTFPSAWTGIGTAFDVSTGISSRDFDADGYAGSGKFALTGVIDFTGQAALVSASGNPIEYRFRISPVATANTNAPLPEANFTQTIGVTSGLFAPSMVAKLVEKVAPFTPYPVMSDLSDFDADGWFDVNNAVARTIINLGLLSLSNYWVVDTDSLMALNTAALTVAPNVPSNAANAGGIFPSGSKIPIEKVAVRFEIREVINKAANIFGAVSGSGKTLNAMIINNNPSFMKFAVQELLTGGDCSPITGTLHAKYTVYHPHLQSVSINVHNNSNSVNKNLAEVSPHVPLFLPLAANTNAAIDSGNNNALQINASPNDLVRCTYAITLAVRRRLHTGSSQVDFDYAQILFFYDI